jgi:hypothetical protein
MKQVVCKCRSHCTRYDPNGHTYLGPGVLVPLTTARRHALDDQRAESLGNSPKTTVPSPLDPPILPGYTEIIGVGELSQGELSMLEAEISGRSAWSPTGQPLVFLTNPGPSQEFNFPNASNVHFSNQGPHALDPTQNTNVAYIENEMRLCEILVQLRELRHSGMQLEHLEENTLEGLSRMWRHKEAEWRRCRYQSIALHYGFPVVNTGAFSFFIRPARILRHLAPYFRSPVPTSPVIAIALLTILILHLVFRVPRRATYVMIAGFRSILAIMPRDEGVPTTIPSDPRTIVGQFDLDPRTAPYLQCPACYAVYSYAPTNTGTLAPPDIERCTFRSTPASEPCDVPLWTERHVGGRTHCVPRRKYVHQSLKEWMGRILAQPGIEDILDRPLKRPPTERFEDIWDSPVFRNFREEDGSHFFAKHGNEARFAFSLGADSFHPLHNLEAKQTMSATAIFLVLLNLPEDQRYKHKNMYLAGVIPGPGKPSITNQSRSFPRCGGTSGILERCLLHPHC